MMMIITALLHCCILNRFQHLHTDVLGPTRRVMALTHLLRLCPEPGGISPAICKQLNSTHQHSLQHAYYPVIRCLRCRLLATIV
jgi:hypothetical protein